MLQSLDMPKFAVVASSLESSISSGGLESPIDASNLTPALAVSSVVTSRSPDDPEGGGPSDKVMAFQGSLAELHLPDVIQLLTVSGKTGAFRLIDGTREGTIFIEDGQIVHAELENDIGEDALYWLVLWSHGEFRFEPGVTTTRRTINKSNTNLLMEAAQRLDEWRVLSRKIPSVDWIPEFVIPEAQDTGGQINLNTSEWIILSKIDGKRSLREISRAAGLSAFVTCKLLYGLVATHLIRVREPESRA